MKKILVSSGIVLVLILFIVSMVILKKTNDKKITFWSIQLKPIYEKQMNVIISDFEKNHQGYKIVWVDIPIQEAQKRTLASILSSTPPDLVNLNPDFSVILAQKNALHIFSEQDTKQFNKSLVDKLKYQGKIYALPYYATSPVTIYNKYELDKCSKKPVKSYSDLEKIALDIKACSNISLFSGSINENDTLAKILNKYGVYDFSEQKQKDKAIDIYSMFNNLYKTNNLPKDILAINHRENIEKYMSNQALVIVAGSNFINMIKQNAPDIYAKSEISNQIIGENEKYDVSLMNLIIPKKAKNKELALEFALQLTNKENQLEFAKLTNVLPANKEALNDEYFKNCSSDLYQKSRCISVNQLNSLVKRDFGDKNKKTINEEINKTLEEILLKENITKDEITNKIENLSKEIKILQE